MEILKSDNVDASFNKSGQVVVVVVVVVEERVISDRTRMMGMPKEEGGSTNSYSRK